MSNRYFEFVGASKISKPLEFNVALGQAHEHGTKEWDMYFTYEDGSHFTIKDGVVYAEIKAEGGNSSQKFDYELKPHNLFEENEPESFAWYFKTWNDNAVYTLKFYAVKF